VRLFCCVFCSFASILLLYRLVRPHFVVGFAALVFGAKRCEIVLPFWPSTVTSRHICSETVGECVCRVLRLLLAFPPGVSLRSLALTSALGVSASAVFRCGVSSAVRDVSNDVGFVEPTPPLSVVLVLLSWPREWCLC